MGVFGFYLLGEEDSVLVEEIAKLHNIDKAVVEKHYRKMLEALKGE